MKKRICFAAATIILSSCSIYTTFKTPEIRSERVSADSLMLMDTTNALALWQAVFVDPHLQGLIERALHANVDLLTAQLTIEQSEAMLTRSKLSYLPSFMLAPEGSLSSFKHAKATSSYSLPLAAQWEIDLFGKLRNSKEQSRAVLLQSIAYKQLIQTQLIAAISNNYYTLLMLDEQLKITQACVENQRQNLTVITAMKEAGMQTEAAVNLAAGSYYGVQASEKELTKQINILQNSIALLLNEVPKAVERSEFSPQPLASQGIHAGISLNALSNRPDVKQAEYLLRESFYGVNLARSAFYPSITLGGSAGWSNYAAGMIENPSKFLLSAIGSLTQPLFNKGANVANLKISKATYEQSMLAFHHSLLRAAVEVNDALISCQNSADKQKVRAQQVQANEKALSNNMELMKYSSTTYLEVLYAENALLQSKLMQVSDWFEGVQGEISLYKALGGGAN